MDNNRRNKGINNNEVTTTTSLEVNTSKEQQSQHTYTWTFIFHWYSRKYRIIKVRLQCATATVLSRLWEKQHLRIIREELQDTIGYAHIVEASRCVLCAIRT